MDVKGPACRVSPAISSSGALSLEDGGKPRRAGQGGDQGGKAELPPGLGGRGVLPGRGGETIHSRQAAAQAKEEECESARLSRRPLECSRQRARQVK